METPFISYLLIHPKSEKDEEDSLPDIKNETISLNPEKPLTFSKVFPESSTIDEIFTSISPSFQDSSSGISSTIIINGPPKSFKTRIFRGSSESPGILNRSISQIFRLLGENFSVHLSILLIFKEQIFDLQSDELLKVRGRPNGEIFIEGLSKVEVFQDFQVFELIGVAENRIGLKVDRWSLERCFSVVYDLNIEEKGFDFNGKKKVSRIRFVNMKPYPIIRKVRNYYLNQRESIHLNRQNFNFFHTVHYLAENKTMIPFRDSSFTYLLKDSLLYSRVIILNCVRNSVSDENIRIIRFASIASKAKSRIKPGLKD